MITRHARGSPPVLRAAIGIPIGARSLSQLASLPIASSTNLCHDDVDGDAGADDDDDDDDDGDSIRR